MNSPSFCLLENVTPLLKSILFLKDIFLAVEFRVDTSFLQVLYIVILLISGLCSVFLMRNLLSIHHCVPAGESVISSLADFQIVIWDVPEWSTVYLKLPMRRAWV